MRRFVIAVLATALVAGYGTTAGRAVTRAADAGSSQWNRHGFIPSVWMTQDGPKGRGAIGSQGGIPSQYECTADGDRPNTNLDCDVKELPNNEADIAVDPLDPDHMIASSNDYDSCCDEYYTTFDGGNTWKTGNMSVEGPNRTGSDPVTSFDARRGIALHPSLNYLFNSEGETNDGDLVVSRSADGGLNWAPPVLVADGTGADSAPYQLFNDKEWITTDNNPSSPHYGRSYLTWSGFVSRYGDYKSSAIYESHSDGGATWSKPKVISGSNAAYCEFQEAGKAGVCDENQFSVPTVAPDGTVYVAFENEQNRSAWESGDRIENQYLVVKSKDGGATWSNPRHVADLEDGDADYPTNVNGRQTVDGFQLRVNSAGNIVADPTHNGRLYIVFSDNRFGQHDPASMRTNTTVFLTTSNDGGATWSKPSIVSEAPGGGPQQGDHWFPWIDVNPLTGELAVIYNDRPSDRFYLQTLATSHDGTHWTFSRVSVGESYPDESLWFQADIPTCDRCATFNGDYNNIEFGPDGRANIVWTSMTRYIDIGIRAGFNESILYASA